MFDVASSDPARTFASTPRFLRPEDPEARRELAIACMALGRNCLSYLRDHAAQAWRALPDNPAHWQAYDELLASPLARLDPQRSSNHVSVVNATREWGMVQVLREGALDVERLHGLVASHRRLLTDAATLGEKMVSVAATGNAISLVNWHLAATTGPPASAAATRLVDSMVAPTTPRERSMRAALAAEIGIVEANAADETGHEALIEDVRRLYAYVADRSEARDFWSSRWEPDTELSRRSSEDWYADLKLGLLVNVHLLDPLLAILRALRRVYAGEISPGVPPEAPPSGWAWQWEREARALCLEPIAVDPSLGAVPTVCLDHLAQ